MSPESQITQIDLSDDASWDQSKLEDTLTQEEKDFLKEKFNEESEGIIYLTQQELTELKANIDYVNHPYNRDGDKGINHFIQAQIEEGLAVSDIVESNGDLPDIIRAQIEGSIDGLEIIANEQLFGEEGIFSSLDISPTAQDHMSVSMSLSFMQHGMGVLQEKIDNNTLTIADIIALNDLGEELELKFAEIKEVADTVLPVMGSPNTIHIAQNGELNTIFMDPSEGISFFDGIISGEINADNVEEKLETGNVDSVGDITVDLPQISSNLNGGINQMAQSIENMSPEQRSELFGALQQASTSATDTLSSGTGETSETSEDNDKKSIWESLMELLKNFFDGIVDLSDSDDVNTDDGEDEVTNPDESEEIAPENIAKNNKLIQMIDDLSSANQDFVNKLKGDTGSVNKIRLILEGISTEQTFEETFEEIFNSEDVLSSNGIRAGKTFEDYGFLESLPDGQSQIQQCIKMLEEYSRYRNSDGVRNLSNGRTTWQQWAEKRQGENWSVSGR